MATVSIAAPVGPVPMPCMASGTAFPSPGRTLTRMAYQINNGPLHPIGSYVPGGGMWNFQLTTADCPQPGPYLLTVFAGDNGGDFTPCPGNFYRQS